MVFIINKAGTAKPVFLPDETSKTKMNRHHLLLATVCKRVRIVVA
jgi:hypothetical protein